MMKKSYFAFLLCSALSLGAVTIADGTRSDYQIVVPDATADRTLDGYVELGGRVIRTAIRKASGAEVPIVKESQMIPGRKAIYVGNTKALKKAGLSSEKFDRWEHSIAVRGNDIFCYGKDSGNPYRKSNMFPALRYPNYFVHYTNGSLKAACVFVEKFANTRFVIPSHNAYGEHEGIRTLPQKKIEIPGNFNCRKKIRFVQMGDMGGLLYSVANGFYFAPGEGYNVHYHAYSIPQKKYYKTHPEYFALINGKRLCHRGDGIHEARPQYCLSNPEVQELIYKNALERADLGYKVVEFGQSDGFIGCQCGKCKAMYNTSDWGEKLWCLHRDMAARLQKDRPGVIPAISCYGPTHQLPKSFKKFPTKGMIIDVAPATKELLEGWKKFNITGMAAWTYYFGSYLASSYAPSCDFDSIQKELRWLYTTPVTYLYNCGIRFAPALNGPWVYAFGKICDDPDLDTRKLLAEYCKFTYGEKAAPHFVKFFLLLDQQSKRYPNPRNEDFNDFNRKKITSTDLWKSRYTPQIVAELQKHFAAGKAVAKPSAFLDQSEREFTYLVLTAKVNNAVWKLQNEGTAANRNALADAIEKRTAFIDSLPSKNGRFYNTFDWTDPVHLKAGGSMSGVFSGAFHSDPKTLRQENKSLDLVKVQDFNDPAWAKIPAQPMTALKSRFPATTATFKAAFTTNALLLKCTAPLAEMPKEPAPPRDSSKLWQQAVWEIFLADGGERRQLVFSAQPKSAFDNSISAYDNHWVRWNPAWSHKDTVKNGVWNAEVTIPFKNVIGHLPEPGDALLLQVGFSTPGARQIYAWNLSISGSFADISGFGAVRLGKRTGIRKINFNGDFSVRTRTGSVYLWNSVPNGTKAEVIKHGGKNALHFQYSGKSYSGIRHALRIPVPDGELLTFRARFSGKGKLSISGGWCNGAGRWVVNEPSQAEFTLTETPVEKTVTFRRSAIAASKGGYSFNFNFYLSAPGGKLVIEDPAAFIQQAK